MYDILFIDDKFEEIKESFSCFQEEHIRCFYSDGENHLPKDDKEKLPFKNLKFLSLDYHLENIGINDSTAEKTALSALSSVVNCFISDKQKKSCKIIINTGFESGFDIEKFISYIGFNIEVLISSKNNSQSKLEEDKTIASASVKNTLRNLVIREAIEIENLIYEKVQKNFKIIVPNLSVAQLDKIKKFDFRAKIQLYKLALNDNDLNTKLDNLRELRNDFAHGNNLQQTDLNLLNFLKQAEDIKSEIISKDNILGT